MSRILALALMAASLATPATSQTIFEQNDLITAIGAGAGAST